MERLTTYNERFGKYQIDGDSGNVMIDGFYHIIGNAVERLAEYENTGLTPEEIKEDTPNIRLIEEKLAAYEDAEENGLIMRLPCKVGDTVYYITDKIKEAKILGFSYYKDKGKELILSGSSFIAAWCTSTKLSNFGKTVFLSREEAEAALATMEGQREV